MGYSVRAVISLVEKRGETKIPIKVSARFSGDPPILIANEKKAKQTLDWNPHYDLSTMIETAWNWHQEKIEIGS